MKKPLIEKEDFYYNEEGNMVMTEKCHLNRGYCCGNGCKHCPYKTFSNSSKGEEIKEILGDDKKS